MPILTIFYDVDYVLEATSAEYNFLWQINHDKVSWASENVRHMITIGVLDSRPICLTYWICYINGKKILVWELTSQLADYKMAEDWLTKNCASYRDGNRCDAMNFGHVLTA